MCIASFAPVGCARQPAADSQMPHEAEDAAVGPDVMRTRNRRVHIPFCASDSVGEAATKRELSHNGGGERTARPVR